MAKKRADGVAASPGNHHQLIEAEIMPLASLKDLRKGAKQTQKDLAASLGVGQDTISRLEKRSDMLLSTLRHYVECVGGQLTLVATFPHQPPVAIDHLGDRKRTVKKQRRARKASVQKDS
jgi:DNA-binding XRE family transcriptional regulator